MSQDQDINLVSRTYRRFTAEDEAATLRIGGGSDKFLMSIPVT